MPITDTISGKPITALPPVSATASPVKTSPEPSVARIGGRPRRETRIPFASPASAPTPSAAAIASKSQIAAPGPTRSAPAKRVSRVAAMTADRFATPTTDRSMPPVIMAIVIASARIANSGNWNAIDVRFWADRNRSGDSAAISANTRTAITARRNSGVRVRGVSVRDPAIPAPYPARAAARLACQAGRPVPSSMSAPMVTDCQVDGIPITIRLFWTRTISATPSSVPVIVP